MICKICKQSKPNRRGITLVELMVSAVLMVAAMSIVAALCFRVSQIWRDVSHHRVAVAELSNHLERLTRMTGSEAREALTLLEPSDYAKQTLAQPKLEGEWVESELGTQINLKLDWKRRVPGKVVTLSGWVAYRPEEESQ